MTKTIAQKLAALGLSLPDIAAPVANYVPAVIHGDLLYISGQLPMRDGALQFKGKLGDTLELAEGQAAAQLCGLNILAQAQTALQGDLERITRVIRLGGFVNCTGDFAREPLVINGASDLMTAIFGDAGRHSRAAIGVNSLPLGAAVEIEALLALG